MVIIALLLRQEFLLVIMGGVFVVETLSVILQVGSFKPVSYTHLDVYKRQTEALSKVKGSIGSNERHALPGVIGDDLLRFGKLPLCLFICIIITAVSYTHLDVYKRQVNSWCCFYFYGLWLHLSSLSNQYGLSGSIF